ncbi:diguanylate cyclase (GGDEF) domain-containing protein [Caenispirillum bisanense]|uniref:Diguanylate cyclase (GGDEF) domain-containing protein n=1 Tax=Caenispirillum bisanense TaxID=414052 RepID=A0A286G188_9PROT|nr:diguanylate cyclase (GGDEF) domain-containing protein [Caenispirillum bisanense]
MSVTAPPAAADRSHRSWSGVLRRHLPVLTLLACLLAGGLLTEGVVRLAAERVAEQRAAAASLFLSGVRARLEGAVGLIETMGEQVANAIRQRPFIDEDAFATVAANARQAVPLIRHLALAPDNVVTMVHPLAGNESALGLRYAEVPEQWVTVEEARDMARNVFSGPVRLVQGGEAFILRIPIFVRRLPYHPDFPMRYWGALSVVVEQQALVTVAGLEDHGMPLTVGWRNEGRSSPAELIAGAGEAFGRDAITLPVRVPGGAWTLAARPVAAAAPEVMLVRIAGWIITALVGGLFFVALRAHRQAAQLALRDHLTGLPNRRLLLERLEQLVALSDRTGMRFAVFYFDLDGFKPVNDRYGHRVGDHLLVEVGQRILGAIRRSDTLARVGGDEFVLVSAETATPAEADLVAGRIRAAVAAPWPIEGEEVRLGTSVGCVIYPTDADTIHGLLEEADARMYADKTEKRGRGRAPEAPAAPPRGRAANG